MTPIFPPWMKRAMEIKKSLSFALREEISKYLFMPMQSGGMEIFMNNRQWMQRVLSHEKGIEAPQWWMGFTNDDHMKKLIPAQYHYDGYDYYSKDGEYSFGPMGEERLKKAVAFNKYIDRIGFAVGFGANAAYGHRGPGEFSDRVIEKMDNGFVVEHETGAKKEVRTNPHNVHTFYYPVTDMASLEALQLPNPSDPKRYEGFAADTKWAKDNGEWTIGYVNGFFSGVHYFVRDYAEFMMDMLCEPEFAAACIKKVGEWNLAAAQKLCESGVDCIGLCDDLGSGQSMLISPELYREMILPWHTKLCQLVHSFGAYVHLHSHGAIMPILSDLIDAGFDILNPVDPDDKMPLDEVLDMSKGKMVLCGGIDKHFFDWSDDEKKAFLTDTVATGRKAGGFILMDSGGIPINVTKQGFDGFLRMSRALRFEGRIF